MRDQGIGSWPERRARGAGARTALIHEAGAETYDSLLIRTRRLGNALHRLGVRPGDRVAYLGPNHPSFVETLFATTALGAVFVPLNTRLAAPELSYQLTHAGAGVLVSRAGLAPTGIDGLVVVGSGFGDIDYEDLIAAAATAPLDIAVTLEDTALILYTSGTTGRPKGVQLTHGNLVWNTYNLLADLDVTSSTVALVNAPLFHTAALAQTFLPTFLKGGTNVLVEKFDATETLRLVAEHRVSYIFGVPTMLRAVAALPAWERADLSSLRLVHCGGAPVPESLIETYQARGLTFVQGYGLTEASPGVLLLGEPESVHKAGTAGASVFFGDVRIAGPDLAPLAVGEPGEILVSGPMVMTGYWQDPDASAVAMADREWLRTGDVGVLDDDGFVTVVDRVKDVFISGGENVYPAEVESLLVRHPAVADCAVIGIADEVWGEVGRALVVLRPGTQAAPEDLLRSLDGQLARYKIPRELVFVDALPRSAAGKLLRAQLPTESPTAG